MNTLLMKSFLVAALVLVAAPALFAADARDAEFAQIAKEYKLALNSYNIDLVTPYLADTLDLRMPLGIQITTPAEFKKYMSAMGNIIGLAKGGKYSIETPESDIRYSVTGEDAVFSAGTIKEQVQFAGMSQVRAYTSRWLVQLKKTDGKWKIVGGSFEVDGSIFSPAEIATYRKKAMHLMQEQ